MYRLSILPLYSRLFQGYQLALHTPNPIIMLGQARKRWLDGLFYNRCSILEYIDEIEKKSLFLIFINLDKFIRQLSDGCVHEHVYPHADDPNNH